MTRDQKIAMLGNLVEEEIGNEAILGIYLDMAGNKILNRMYPYRENYDGLEVPDRYLMVQMNIAVYLLNKRGAEGQIQHIENGIQRNYGAADVPDGMLADVVPFCQAVR